MNEVVVGLVASWYVLSPSFVLICSSSRLPRRKDKQHRSLKWDRQQIWKSFFCVKIFEWFSGLNCCGCEFMLWGVYWLLSRGSNIPPSPQSATNPKLAHPLHPENYGKPLHQRSLHFYGKRLNHYFSGFLKKSSLEFHLYQCFSGLWWKTISLMFICSIKSI